MKSESGLTIIEMLVTLAIVGIIAGIVALNLRPLSQDASNAANTIAAYLKQVRARAMTTTSAYRIIYVSDTELQAEWALSCASADWQPEQRFRHSLSGGAKMLNVTAGTILTCFSPRGISDSNTELSLKDDRERFATLELFLGGGVEIR